MAEKQLTDKERIEKLSREERNRAAFAAVKDALSIIDLTQNRNISYTTYSRESLRDKIGYSLMVNHDSIEVSDKIFERGSAAQKELNKLSPFAMNKACVYEKKLTVPAFEANERVYLDFAGVNASAKVIFNLK